MCRPILTTIINNSVELSTTKTTAQTAKLAFDTNADHVTSESESTFRSTDPSDSDNSTDVCIVEGLNLQVAPSSFSFLSSTKPNNSILKQSSSSSDVCIREQGPWKGLPEPDMQLLHKRLKTRLQRAKRTEERSVTFDCVILRRYNQTLGDNPAVPFGPPIQLDWEFEEQVPIPINEFEGRRRKWIHPRQMHLSYFQRRSILSYYYGFTEDQMCQAERAVHKVRQQRYISKLFRGIYIFEDFASDAIRRTKRLMCKTTSSTY
jgi:hypothetical protein